MSTKSQPTNRVACAGGCAVWRRVSWTAVRLAVGQRAACFARRRQLFRCSQVGFCQLAPYFGARNLSFVAL